MFPKNESNDGQNLIHTVIEETNSKSDAPRGNFVQNSIKTGTSPFIHLFMSSHFSLFLFPIMIKIWIPEISPTSSTLLAWSSEKNNRIRVVELETKQEFTNFDGVQFKGLFLKFFSILTHI